MAYYLFQALAACCVFIIGRWIYRLTLHPLANVPGPKLAGMTSAHSMYFDLSQKTSLVEYFGKWHEKYGPVVRIEPNHVHILDIDAYNAVFKIGTQFSRDPAIYGFPFTRGGFFKKLHVKDAKPHRDLYNAYFSRNSIQSLEPAIRDDLTKWLRQVDKYAQSNAPIDFSRGFRCLVADTVTRYIYNKPLDAIAAPEWKLPIMEHLLHTQENGSYNRYFSTLFNLIAETAKAAPRAWSSVDGGVAGMLYVLDTAYKHVDQLRREPTGKQTPSIFQIDINPNPDKGHPTLSNEGLAADGLTFFIAGTDTTAHTLMTGTYHLLRNPAVLAKLQAELRNAIPFSTSDTTSEEDFSDFPLTWTQLESLPYIRSVIKESLRFASPTPGKLPRMVPPGGATLAGTYLPAGTAVSMALHTFHRHAAFYPDPDSFTPERWLDSGSANGTSISNSKTDSEEGGPMDPEKAFIPFSRGSRNCIGQNLAWAETYYTFAYLFRRFELEIVEGKPGRSWDDGQWKDGEGTTEWGMSWKDQFTTLTRGHLILKAKRCKE